MIVYLQLNEDASHPGFTAYQDRSPYEHEGTCGSACPVYSTAGTIDQAQVFDGVDTSVELPASAAFDWAVTDSFSIEFWTKVSTATGARRVAVGRSDVSSSLEWWVGLDASGRAAAGLAAVDGSGFGVVLSGSQNLENDTWHHIAFVRAADVDENRLYVDGQPVDSAAVTYTAGFGSDTAGLNLGRIDSGDGSHLQGNLDDLALYATALSPEQIAQHHNDGRIGLASGYCSDDPPIRIMPLGNSITRGSYGDSTSEGYLVGYRKALFLDLSDKNQDGDPDFEVDFVGSTINGWLDSIFDWHHEGHGGILADELALDVSGYLAGTPADVVLLHIGTNDVDTLDSAGQISQEVAAILDIIDSVDPGIVVVVAKIIDRQTHSTKTVDFNDIFLEPMVNARIADGDRLILVDHYAALNYETDMSDQRHPNLTGYEKMAQVWYDGLESFLPPTYIRSPVITSVPKTRANVGAAYRYTVEAEGNEAPQFSLIDPAPLPDDMAIDAVNGALTWTPSTTGPVDVSVEASNTANAAIQSYTIVVGSNPSADNDAYGPFPEGSLFEVASLDGVLSNDVDIDADDLQAELLTDVNHGMLTLDPDGAFAYTHDGSESVSDAFVYRAHDGVGYSEPATVVLTVAGVNDPPVITGQDALAMAKNTALTVLLDHIHVQDPDNTYPDEFTLVLSPGDHYTLQGDTLKPEPVYVGTLTVPVTVNDGIADSDPFDLYIEVEDTCPGDFDNDGDVDGSDLAVFAADFGRTNCSGDCEGDFDDDNDVDGSDLATFAADFGRTDCL